MKPLAPNFAGGIILFLIWLVMMGGMLIGWIIGLVALWRGMKAHESIAHSLKQMAEKSQSQQEIEKIQHIGQ